MVAGKDTRLGEKIGKEAGEVEVSAFRWRG